MKVQPGANLDEKNNQTNRVLGGREGGGGDTKTEITGKKTKNATHKTARGSLGGCAGSVGKSEKNSEFGRP